MSNLPTRAPLNSDAPAPETGALRGAAVLGGSNSGPVAVSNLPTRAPLDSDVPAPGTGALRGAAVPGGSNSDGRYLNNPKPGSSPV